MEVWPKSWEAEGAASTMNHQKFGTTKNYLISRKNTHTKIGKNPGFPQGNSNKNTKKIIIQCVNVLLVKLSVVGTQNQSC